MSSLPASPISPNTSVDAGDPRPKKSNPLTDLIDTEKAYVEQLTGIIRKVAAAWSRSNLPPPELDSMFRCIESIYKANRNLHSRLKEIGANPSSPKALGDLLMRWIDDLETPYTNYAHKYTCGFDNWDPVKNNTRLPTVLSTFSASNPPPSNVDQWTLDVLFLLPKGRLKYYRRLYGRLLKSTAPGRSDHKLLVAALDKLDGLLQTIDARGECIVGQPSPPTPPPPPAEHEEDEVIDLRTQSVIAATRKSEGGWSEGDHNPGSENSSARGSNTFSASEHSSRDTGMTSVSRGSTNTMNMPIADLEKRLSTARCLDLFTMQPKGVRLQMNPPTLTFTRELRLSMDIVVRFTPRSTGVEVVHEMGHIYLLSDLFLCCEKMTQEEQHQQDGADMWLCYPPLAGKVLRVSDVPGQDNAVQIAIMRKEHFILECESPSARDVLMRELKDCIEFAASLPPPSKVPPPPVPSINPALMGGGLPSGPASQMPSRNPSVMSSHSTLTSPSSDGHGNLPPLPPPPPQYQENNSPDGLSRNMSNMRLSDDRQFAASPPQARQFTSPPPVSFKPGEVIPMNRNPSLTGPHGAYQQPPFPPQRQMSQGGYGPPRPPSEPSYGPGPSFNPGELHKAPSTRSLHAGFEQYQPMPHSAPPVPGPHPGYPNAMSPQNTGQSWSPNGGPHNGYPGGPPPHMQGGPMGGPMGPGQRGFAAPQPRMLVPQLDPRAMSMIEAQFAEPSPPNSPVEETPAYTGPTTTTVSAQMKCKVFLKQTHAQWKALGAAKLKLYHEDPTNKKQLVVEAEDKHHSVMISTIVQTDGVERVGKTGVAIELSDNGRKTGIVYMIQLRNENSTRGLYDSLLAGSDRRA